MSSTAPQPSGSPDRTMYRTALVGLMTAVVVLLTTTIASVTEARGQRAAANSADARVAELEQEVRKLREQVAGPIPAPSVTTTTAPVTVPPTAVSGVRRSGVLLLPPDDNADLDSTDPGWRTGRGPNDDSDIARSQRQASLVNEHNRPMAIVKAGTQVQDCVTEKGLKDAFVPESRLAVGTRLCLITREHPVLLVVRSIGTPAEVMTFDVTVLE